MPSMTSLPVIVVGRETLGRDAAAHAHAAPVAEVREDAEADPRRRRSPRARSATASATVLTRFAPIASRQSTMTWTTIMSSGEHPRLDAARAAAARDEARDRRVGQRQELSARGAATRAAAAPRVAHVAELDLRDHERRVDLGHEAAAGADHLRRVRRRGDDARLLDDHRHDVVVPVDAHVERDAVRQRVRAEDVLDELVGGLGVEPSAVEGALDVAAGSDAGRVAHERAALLRR